MSPRRRRDPRPPLHDRLLLRFASSAATVAALVAVVEAGRKWR